MNPRRRNSGANLRHQQRRPLPPNRATILDISLAVAEKNNNNSNQELRTKNENSLFSISPIGGRHKLVLASGRGVRVRIGTALFVVDAELEDLFVCLFVCFRGAQVDARTENSQKEEKNGSKHRRAPSLLLLPSIHRSHKSRARKTPDSDLLDWAAAQARRPTNITIFVVGVVSAAATYEAMAMMMMMLLSASLIVQQ